MTLVVAVATSASGVALLVAKLGLLWVALVVCAEKIVDDLPARRIRLAGRDDSRLNFRAALDCGPLPPYRDETDGVHGAGKEY